MPDPTASQTILQQYLAATDPAAFLRSLTDAQRDALSEIACALRAVVAQAIEAAETVTQPGRNVV